MKATKIQLFLIFLNKGTPLSHYGIKYEFKKHYGEEAEGFKFLYPALTELIAMDVVEEYDILSEGGVDIAIYSHPEHGDLQFSDFDSVDGVDDVLHLSSGALAFALDNVAGITNEAAKAGFDRALRTMTALPIDSTAWTGLPKGFVFTEQTKLQLIRLLDEAALALEKSGLSNFQIGQGAAYLRAAKILAEAPEPPKNEIWDLLQKGSAIASLASLFAPILNLFRVQ